MHGLLNFPFTCSKNAFVHRPSRWHSLCEESGMVQQREREEEKSEGTHFLQQE